jgi:hypothetical protein
MTTGTALWRIFKVWMIVCVVAVIVIGVGNAVLK